MESQHDNYVRNAIIPPPQNVTSDIEPKTKVTRIVIDSKDRDVELFPEPSSYEVRLEDDIDDVISAQLITADVPLSSYMINRYFKTFILKIGATSYEVVLEEGNYGVLELAQHITEKLNSISNNFLAEYVSIKDNFQIKSKVAFSLSFNNTQNSIAQLLGFIPQEYACIASDDVTYPYIVKSVYRKNFNFNNYVIMNIDHFDVIKSNGNKLHRTFAVINGNQSDLAFTDMPTVIKSFNPPVPRLAKLKISFTDRFGNLYDFQNVDHRIELLFTSFKQKRKYQSIFLNR